MQYGVSNVILALAKIVNFQKSNKVNLLLIGLGFVLVIGTLIFIIILKKRSK